MNVVQIADLVEAMVGQEKLNLAMVSPIDPDKMSEPVADVAAAAETSTVAPAPAPAAAWFSPGKE